VQLVHSPTVQETKSRVVKIWSARQPLGQEKEHPRLVYSSNGFESSGFRDRSTWGRKRRLALKQERGSNCLQSSCSLDREKNQSRQKEVLLATRVVAFLSRRGLSCWEERRKVMPKVKRAPLPQFSSAGGQSVPEQSRKTSNTRNQSLTLNRKWIV
jgi:hypothetical protein